MIKIRYLLLIALLGCSNFVFAQAWGGGADQEDLSFGFTFSYVKSTFKITKQPSWRNPFIDTETGKSITPSYKSISSDNMPGFAIGFLTRYRLTEHLEARVTPSLVFADRSVSYRFVSDTIGPSPFDIDRPVQTTMLDFPLQIKLKSDRVGNLRAYLIGGAKYSGAIGTKKDASTDPLEKTLKNVKGYASYEAGFGFDIYFEYFKLSPEIKMSNSIGNLLVAENTPYASPIQKLGLRTLMFSLIFE